MRLRSTCSRWLFTGSYCSSTTITGVFSCPAMSTLKMVLCPVLLRRICWICLGVDGNGNRVFEGPVDHAWNHAAHARTPRFVLAAGLAHFRGYYRICSQLLFSCSRFPGPSCCSWAGALLNLLTKQTADRRLFVYRLNRPRQQRRNRQHPNLAARLRIRRRAEWNSKRSLPLSSSPRSAQPPDPTAHHEWHMPSRSPRRNSSSASVPLTRVPAVSIMSSTIRQLRPLTSPITFITSATLASSRRLSIIASGAFRRLATERARSTPPASGETTIRSGISSRLK